MNFIRTFRLLVCWLPFLWPGVAFAQTAQLTTPTTSYSPTGGTITLTLTINYAEKTLSVLGARIVLPAGWSFSSASGASIPEVVPVAGTTGAAEFGYITIPANSATFTFTLMHPAGLSRNQSLTGSVVYKVKVNDGAGGAPSQQTLPLADVVLSPAAAPAITSATTSTATVGVTYSYTTTASPAATSFTIGGLPAGLTANPATGVISGTPTTAGTSAVSLSATGPGGSGPVTTLTLTVAPAPGDNSAKPAITSANTANAILGEPFRFAVLTSPAATSFAATGLPAGVTIDATTGLITGTFTRLANYPVTVTATNSAGSTTQVLSIAVNSKPTFIAFPQGAGVRIGGSLVLTATVDGSPTPTYQWQKNGVPIPGATASTLPLTAFQVGDAGAYALVATNLAGSATSPAAIVGVRSSDKVAGAGNEVGSNIVAANGNVYDQVLLTGNSTTITADPAQITRLSFIDLNDDIVQVEFSGAGTLTLTLENASGPAAPTKYNQAGVLYMKGHASLVLSGADESTNVSVFSVGSLTALNQALFKSGETYDGLADIALISIVSANGRFGGLRTANAAYFHATGLTGIYAPGVAVAGPTYLHEITADGEATPILVFAATTDVRIAGGNLLQLNQRAVQVDGITHLAFTPGVTSGNVALPAQANRAHFERNGVDVTAQLLAPGP